MVIKKITPWIIVGITSACAIIFAILYISHVDHGGTFIFHDKGKTNILTNPILDCELATQGDESIISRDEISSISEKTKKLYNLTSLSIYFRDLNNGPWIGINEKEYFSPASLLKTPLYISFLRFVEDYPDASNKKIVITENDIVRIRDQKIKPLDEVQVGQEYTLTQLAERMIVYSDNSAAMLLGRHVPLFYINDIYKSIGSPFETDGGDLQVRVKDIASFFRILYNASYLSRQNSEHALQVLTTTTYKDGLSAGVPDDVVVAHKFGERSASLLEKSGINVPSGINQVHDCGIVYYQERPYILCIMTRGFDIKKQQQAIASLSTFFYKSISEK